MGKAKMLGYQKPYTPNNRADRKRRPKFKEGRRKIGQEDRRWVIEKSDSWSRSGM